MVDKYYREPRKRMRLEGYDYSQEGIFYITVCTKNRDLLLWDEPVIEMLEKYWHKIPDKFTGIELDEFVIMPNHIHGILFNVGADPCVGPSSQKYVGHSFPKCVGPSSLKTNLPHIAQWYKTMTTNAYLTGIKEKGWRSFMGKLWQRGYYERIIRSEEELNILRKYIIENPENWDNDEENREGPTHGSAPTKRDKCIKS
jgi:REP-associated tyrosine transposase